MSLTAILVTCIIGLVAGAIAKLLMPGKDPGGCIITMLLGIAGAWVGTLLAQALHIVPTTGFGSFVAAVIGAMILLLIYRLIFGKRT